MLRKPQEIIKEITDSLEEGEHYIYRGVSGYKDDYGVCHKDDEDRVASSFYRKYRKNFKDEIVDYSFELWGKEANIVERAEKQFFGSNNDRDREVLTDLRHFGASVNLIDFSYSLNVALFFACDGGLGEEGELVALPIKNKIENGIVDPVKTENSKMRITAQDSIFVYSEKGYLDKEESKLKFFSIQPEEKGSILEYLENFHNISEKTIYNDLVGFVQNEKKRDKRRLFVFQAIDSKRQNDTPVKKVLKIVEEPMSSKEVARDLNEAVRMVCEDETLISLHICAFLFHTTGWSNYNLKDYEKASIAFKKQIEIFEKTNKRFGTPYFACGQSEYHLKKYESTIKCLDKEIELGHVQNKAQVYFLRGLAKRALDNKEGAQKDFQRAQELDLNIEIPPRKLASDCWSMFVRENEFCGWCAGETRSGGEVPGRGDRFKENSDSE